MGGGGGWGGERRKGMSGLTVTSWDCLARARHTPSIAFRHLPPRKEGCRKPVLWVWEHGWLLPPPLSGWRLWRTYWLHCFLVRMAVAPCLTVKPIIGGSCHKYNFCRDKHVLVATKQVFCRDKSMLAATKRLPRKKYVCRDKIFFGATKRLSW